MLPRKYRGLIEAVVLAVVAGSILAAGWYAAVVYACEKAYTPNNLIRLHIIPNSDSGLDQELKMAVRDALLEELAPLLTGERSFPLDKLQRFLPGIERMVRTVIERYGVDYGVHPEIGAFWFPEATYDWGSGRLTLHQGRYYALRVILGEGKGRNWWCILFPPLCFLDVVAREDRRACPVDAEMGATRALTGIDSEDIQRIVEQVPEEIRTEFRFYLTEILRTGREALSAAIARFRNSFLLCPAPVETSP